MNKKYLLIGLLLSFVLITACSPRITVSNEIPCVNCQSMTSVAECKTICEQTFASQQGQTVMGVNITKLVSGGSFVKYHDGQKSYYCKCTYQ